ncbi:MAG: DUF4331 family protein [Myxococcales bacterium]|nr:DUF4331 family protein [Myxococcales bacterium]
MMHRGILAALAVALLAAPAQAFDHRDGTVVLRDPAADIADLYAWMSADGSRIYLVLTVFPGAQRGARFSDAVHYVFHTTSRPTATSPMATPLDIICSFDAAQRIRCWVGADPAHFVSGDASSPVGVRSPNGKVRVFAGLRKDPFFFNQEGFQTVAARIAAAAPMLMFDAANCPALTPAQAREMYQGLERDRNGRPAKDAFRSEAVLALVMEVDKALLTRGGPFITVWAATHAKGR